jgi:hypothetical protein
MKDPISFEIGGKARTIEGLVNALSLDTDSAKSNMKIINVSKIGFQ